MYKRVLAVAMTAALLMSACGSGSSSDPADTESGPVTLTFGNWTLGSQFTSPGMTQVMEAFAAEHPDITVELETSPSDSDLTTFVSSAIAAGDTPDIVEVTGGQRGYAVQNYPFTPIDEVAGQAWSEFATQIPEGMLNSGVIDGVQASIPHAVGVQTVYYNKELFADAGLDPDSPPLTWNDVTAAARAIVDRTDADGVYIPLDAEATPQSMVLSSGAELLNAAGRPDLPESGRMTADLIGTWARDGLFPSVARNDAESAFVQGQLGMFIVTSSRISVFLDQQREGVLELGVGPMPGFGTTPATPVLSGSWLMVLADEPATQQAAWTFIDFITGPKAAGVITSEVGYIPVRDAPPTAELTAYLEQHPQADAVFDQSASAVGQFIWPGVESLEVSKRFTEAFTNIVLAQADPTESLAEAQEQISGLLP